MTIKFKNFAASTIANVGGIAANALSLDVQPGDGALFPSLAAGEYFYCVLVTAAGAREIVKVTARSTDTFTIVRAQDSTNAIVFDADDVVELRVTAKVLEELRDIAGGPVTMTATIAEINTTCDGNTATAAEIVKAADGIGVTIPRQIIYEMGAWNMDTTSSIGVAHGLTSSKIVGVRATIRSDSIATVYPLPYAVSGTSLVDPSVYANSVSLVCGRETGGIFDSISYSSVAINRGWFIVDYID